MCWPPQKAPAGHERHQQGLILLPLSAWPFPRPCAAREGRTRAAEALPACLGKGLKFSEAKSGDAKPPGISHPTEPVARAVPPAASAPAPATDRAAPAGPADPVPPP